MAYDRYDTGPGRDYPRREHDERSRRDERGFFERAGEQIASWFGDEEDDDRLRGRGGERGRNWAPEHGWGGDPQRSRGAWRGRQGWRDVERDDNRGMSWEPGRETGRERGYRPMTGDYGRSLSGWDRDDERSPRFGGSPRGSERDHSPIDRHYHAWRQRQLDELDRDYEEYHRERQQHFENDFGSWRQTRQQKRQLLGQAREHMAVVASDGETLGKVDRIAGDRLILTKSDSPDGRHHSIPCTMIERIEGDQVMLGCNAEEAQKNWRDDDRERALFERDDQGESGPHMLDRSFSGTYRG